MANVCRWMAEQAEGLGVEIFPGMAASALTYEGETVRGVIAGEFGPEKDGTPGPNYEPGMELRGKYVFLCEGVRGSLTKQVMSKYDLSAGREPQKFGLGMKEIWEVRPESFHPGQVTHTLGWRPGTAGRARHARTGDGGGEDGRRAHNAWRAGGRGPRSPAHRAPRGSRSAIPRHPGRARADAGRTSARCRSTI